MIDLYYYTSPNVRKVVIALEELGLPYTVHWTDITAGDQFADSYLAINPNAKVPAIVDHDGPDGTTLTLFESAAILLYLAEKTGRLVPSDPSRRWAAIAWTVWQVANHGPMTGQATHFLEYAPAHGIDDEYAQHRYHAETVRLYEILDRRLADREYLADEFSIADIACFPWVRVSRGHRIDVADFPSVARWVERISARPSAQVRLSDPREEKAARHEYDAQQFATLFRSGPSRLAAPATIASSSDSTPGGPS